MAKPPILVKAVKGPFATKPLADFYGTTWLELVAEILRKTEFTDPETRARQEAEPEWVRKLAAKAGKEHVQRTRDPKEARNPKELGERLGWQYAKLGWIVETSEKESHKISGLFSDGFLDSGDVQEAELARQLGNDAVLLLKHFPPKWDGVMLSAFILAFKEGFTPFAEFLAGFNSSLVAWRKQQAFLEQTSRTDYVQSLMLNRWEEVMQLHSIPQLCSWLVQRLPPRFQVNLVQWNRQDLRKAFERQVEQMCRRIGLKLARRGRPRKKPTTV